MKKHFSGSVQLQIRQVNVFCNWSNVHEARLDPFFWPEVKIFFESFQTFHSGLIIFWRIGIMSSKAWSGDKFNV